MFAFNLVLGWKLSQSTAKRNIEKDADECFSQLRLELYRNKVYLLLVAGYKSETPFIRNHDYSFIIPSQMYHISPNAEFSTSVFDTKIPVYSIAIRHLVILNATYDYIREAIIKKGGCVSGEWLVEALINIDTFAVIVGESIDSVKEFIVTNRISELKKMS